MIYETNENINAIITGMDLKHSDKVLAVCGSSSQAFAILEYANEVYVIDKDHRQVDYAKQRADFIRNYQYKEFLSHSHENEKVYFNRERLDRIRENINEISFECINLADIESFSRFTKVYLSNALDADYTPFEDSKHILELLEHDLAKRGLLCAGGKSVEAGAVTHLCKKFVLDDKLTQKAAEHENDWPGFFLPTIYRHL